MNRTWDVHRDRPIYIGKPRQLLMAALVGMLFALSLLAPTLLRVTANVSESDLPGVGLFYDGAARIGFQGLSLGLTIVIFLAIYKFLPNTNHPTPIMLPRLDALDGPAVSLPRLAPPLPALRQRSKVRGEIARAPQLPPGQGGILDRYRGAEPRCTLPGY